VNRCKTAAGNDEMDATQKRRMWKVTSVHFALSVFVALIILFFEPVGFSGNHEARIRFNQWLVWHNAWFNSWETIFCFLQPQIAVFYYLIRHTDILLTLRSIISPNAFLILYSVATIPLWSICFGRLFVRAKDWLNHFPVLGKKVF
jgi:hypothetical protein